MRILTLSLLTLLSSAGLNALTFTPSEVNWGTLPQGKHVERDVTLTNDEKVAVEIVRVQSDCGCTVGEAEKKLLLPGESTKLKVGFSSGTFMGPIHRQITVSTKEQSFALKLFSQVTPLPGWEVDAAPLTAKFAPGKTASKTFTIKRPAGDNIVSVNNGEQPLPFTYTVKNEENQSIITIATTGVNEPIQYFLEVKTEKETGRIPVRIELDLPFNVGPNPITLPVGSVNQETSGSFYILNWLSANPPQVDLFGTEEGKATVTVVANGPFSYLATIKVKSSTSGRFRYTARVSDIKDSALTTQVPVWYLVR